MPTGIYIRKEETKKRLSESLKGKIPWNKGLSGEEVKKYYQEGNIGWFKKGNEFSKNRLGKKQSIEQIQKRVESTKGYKHSEETKLKMSKNRKGKRLGITLSKEHKDKISFGLRKDNNGMWKGDNISYKGIHEWIHRNKPKPLFCEFCGKNKPYDVANVNNHNYTRNLNDYKWSCRSCHKKLDSKKSQRELSMSLAENMANNWR